MDDWTRNPAALVVLAAMLALLTGLLWRVLDRQKLNAEQARMAIEGVKEATMKVGIDLIEHVAREDSAHDSTVYVVGELAIGQAELRTEMREHVSELRGDVRAVHARLDAVLGGNSELT